MYGLCVLTTIHKPVRSKSVNTTVTLQSWGNEFSFPMLMQSSLTVRRNPISTSMNFQVHTPIHPLFPRRTLLTYILLPTLTLKRTVTPRRRIVIPRRIAILGRRCRTLLLHCPRLFKQRAQNLLRIRGLDSLASDVTEAFRPLAYQCSTRAGLACCAKICF